MILKFKKNNILPKNLPPTRPPRLLSGMSGAATYHLPPSRGFTLIELLVTLSLFVVLTIIVIFSQSKFNGSILLTNLAYDVALTARQAQSFGVNVRENTLDTSSGTSFKHAYGVHFDIDITKNKQFLLFSDSVGGDGKYDSGTDSLVNKYSIKRGSYISDICVDSNCDVNTLDITFLRPNPDAIIKYNACLSDCGSEAKITISSSDEKTRTVTVNATGQISIGR